LTFASRIPGIAGPAGFQRRLAKGLAARGVDVGYGLEAGAGDVVLVIGGTRDLPGLWRARRQGASIVHRLNGINWVQRRRRTGPRHFLRAELNNALLRLIRDRLATSIAYQSRFARGWWERVYGAAPVRSAVIHNGVPLDEYAPMLAEAPEREPVRLLMVEANLAGGYEVGLEWALGWAPLVQSALGARVELVVAGRVPEKMRALAEARLSVRWLGVVQPDRIPALDRSAHVLFSADVMPACPNAVIEALACGLPAVSFDTGALPELVTGEAGRIVPYGGDPWRLESPDLAALARAAAEVVRDQPRFRAGARARAEAGLGLETMLDGYMAAFGW
jgi:glycosyltransferase involved in cell wall biosynthesis